MQGFNPAASRAHYSAYSNPYWVAYIDVCSAQYATARHDINTTKAMRPVCGYIVQ